MLKFLCYVANKNPFGSYSIKTELKRMGYRWNNPSESWEKTVDSWADVTVEKENVEREIRRAGIGWKCEFGYQDLG